MYFLTTEIHKLVPVAGCKTAKNELLSEELLLNYDPYKPRFDLFIIRLSPELLIYLTEGDTSKWNTRDNGTFALTACGKSESTSIDESVEFP